MGLPYAEVIGDPIAHSKSPLIHGHWLRETGIAGEYRATRVAPDELPAYFAARRADPDWRGCNVTIPHKSAVIPLLDAVAPGAEKIGAVNCITPGPGGLSGTNTDIDGVAAALGDADLQGRKVAMIGAGGGARAAMRYLLDLPIAKLALIVRDPVKAYAFHEEDPERVTIHALDEADAALESARAIVNASPMGMDGAVPMPPGLLAAISRHARDALLFDMVYAPLNTEFLSTGATQGGVTVDGLQMLIGQARAAFALFFGHPAPADGADVRALLTT